jgi:CRP-like cAMP-binding protein
LEEGGVFHRDADALPQLAEASAFRRYRRGDLLLAPGTSATDVFLVVAGQLAVTVPTEEGENRLELVPPGELMVLQEMLSGGPSPVRVVAHLDTDVLAIPAHALVDAMDRSRVVARDIQSRYRSTASGYPAAQPQTARCRITQQLAAAFC